MGNEAVVSKSTNKSGFKMSRQGFFVVLLSFVSMYTYSSLVGDSLNVTINVFAAMGLQVNVMYLMATVSVIFGIIGSILVGRLLNRAQVRVIWGICEIIGAVFTFIWANIHTTIMYAVCYIVVYTATVIGSQMLVGMVAANWFPKTRGVAAGIYTIGFPLSAATSTSLVSVFVASKFGVAGYYMVMAVIMAVVGVCLLVFVRDNPEEKGCYPDNNKAFDYEQLKREHQENLEYQKHSKWKTKAVLTCGRFWLCVLAMVVLAFASQGIMANFVNRFMETGYQLPEILGMLAIAGILAIPMSVLFGWIDVRFGSKKTGILVNALAVIGIVFATLDIHVLNYISLPILAVMLGGANNLTISIISSIWGRYNFQNVMKVYMPISIAALGLGITVVGIIGTNISYRTAYVTILVLTIISFITMCLLKVKPIDDDVR